MPCSNQRRTHQAEPGTVHRLRICMSPCKCRAINLGLSNSPSPRGRVQPKNLPLQKPADMGDGSGLLIVPRRPRGSKISISKNTNIASDRAMRLACPTARANPIKRPPLAKCRCSASSSRVKAHRRCRRKDRNYVPSEIRIPAIAHAINRRIQRF